MVHVTVWEGEYLFAAHVSRDTDGQVEYSRPNKGWGSDERGIHIIPSTA